MRVAEQFAKAGATIIADDNGQDLLEYALLTAIISIAGVLILATISTTMRTGYTSVDTAGQTAWHPCPPLPAACP